MAVEERKPQGGQGMRPSQPQLRLLRRAERDLKGTVYGGSSTQHEALYKRGWAVCEKEYDASERGGIAAEFHQELGEARKRAEEGDWPAARIAAENAASSARAHMRDVCRITPAGRAVLAEIDREADAENAKRGRA